MCEQEEVLDIYSLPPEIIYTILEMCDPKDYIQCLNSSKIFHPVNYSQYGRKRIEYNTKKIVSNETKYFLSAIGIIFETVAPLFNVDLTGYREHLLEDAEYFEEVFQRYRQD